MDLLMLLEVILEALTLLLKDELAVAAADVDCELITLLVDLLAGMNVGSVGSVLH